MHERLTAVFTELGVDYEIIFVNDGSPDDSREVLLDGDLQDPPELIAAVDRLRPGTLMLTQPDEFDAPVKRAGKRPLRRAASSYAWRGSRLTASGRGSGSRRSTRAPAVWC